MAKRSFRGKPKKQKTPRGDNMMSQFQKMQQDMAAAQAALEQETVTVTAGGGAISIVITGHQRLQSIEIDPLPVVDIDPANALRPQAEQVRRFLNPRVSLGRNVGEQARPQDAVLPDPLSPLGASRCQKPDEWLCAAVAPMLPRTVFTCWTILSPDIKQRTAARPLPATRPCRHAGNTNDLNQMQPAGNTLCFYQTGPG